MSILDIIATHSGSFTKAQQKIAFYLIQDPHQISFLNLRDLSKSIGVTEVTIINFCRAIGLESFSQLKSEFQKLLLNEIQVPKDIKRSLEEISSEEDAYENTIQVQRDNHLLISRKNSLESISSTADVIIGARKVYLSGVGISKILADFMLHRLRLLDIDVEFLDCCDVLDTSLILTSVHEKDCFILMSFPHYAHQIRILAEYLHDHEIPYIGISDSEETSMMKMTPHKLFASGEAVVFHNFLSNAISLVEILLVLISYKKKDQLEEFLSELGEIREGFTEYI